MKNSFKLVLAILISELAGIIGSVFTTPSISGWYSTLLKPELAPPNWIFGPVWTSLFALMGIAAFLVWKKGLDRKDVKIALTIFIVQLILNTLWSMIFFGLQSPAGAFIEIIFLWLAILATIIVFAKISRPAAWLLLPYILWVSFAGYLNYSIWHLNSQQEPIPWRTVLDGKSGITFKYPDTLPTEYIHTVDWPPQIQILNEPFTCTEAGLENSRAGQTMSQTINGRTYCITKESEGAAGSIYTNYAYAFSLDNPSKSTEKTAIFTFSLRTVQCENYDDPQKTSCKKEQSSFDVNKTVDRIARSIDL